MSTLLSDCSGSIAHRPSRSSEIESTLLHLSSLLSLPTTVPAAERAYNHSELLGTLISLEADLEELEESVHAVEEDGVARRLGIAKEEVARRRAFVERVRGVVRVSVWSLA